MADTHKQGNSPRGTASAPESGSALVYVQHERWMADRWKVMFQANGLKFMIGAACSTKQEAERMRDEFTDTLGHLGVNLPNEKE